MWQDRLKAIVGSGRAAALALVAAVAVVYLPSLSGGFLIDDDVLLTESRLIQAPDGIWRFWFSTEAVDYWPLSNSSLWLEWRLWGMRPFGYRVTNVLLHIAESLLFWRILRELAIPGAFLAALLFAVHPLNVEAVAWIAQRKTLMALLFAQLATLAFLRSPAGANNEHNQPWHRDGWYWLAVVAFACAMLSKVSAVVFPVLLAWVMWWTRSPARPRVAPFAPLFAVAVALLAVNVWFRAHDPNIHVAIDPLESALRAPYLLWFYLGKAVLPIDLYFMYDIGRVDPADWRWWIPLLAALATTAVLLSWRHRRGVLLFAWGYYVLAMLPALGLTEVPFVEDHYQHFALIGVTSLFAAAWQSQRHRAAPISRRALEIAAVAVVCALAVLSWRHAATFTDNVVLMRAAVEAAPTAVSHRNLGYVLMRAGRPAEALPHMEESLRLDPQAVDGHKKIAIVLAELGDKTRAIQHSQAALMLSPDDPETLDNLGSLLRESGRAAEAVPHFERALSMRPASVRTRCNLGKSMLELGEVEKAIEQFEHALRIDPRSAEAARLLAAARNTPPAPPDY